MLNPGFCTYIVTNKRNGTLYTGHTDTIGDRALEHREGLIDGFSKRHGCRHLVWYEAHDTRDDAFRRERRIKTWNRAWKIGLIEEMNPHWLDIGATPVWPLPDPRLFPDLYEKCFRFALPR